jgi:hypothetical protein
MTMIMVAGCGYWRGIRLCRLWRHLRPKRYRGGKTSDEKHGSIASFVAGKSSGMPRDFSHRRPCLTLYETRTPMPVLPVKTCAIGIQVLCRCLDMATIVVKLSWRDYLNVWVTGIRRVVPESTRHRSWGGRPSLEEWWNVVQWSITSKTSANVPI